MNIRPALRPPATASLRDLARSVLRVIVLGAGLLGSATLAAQTVEDALGAGVQEQARALALDSARPAAGLRVEVELGRLDPRLKLAPCAQIQPYLPVGYKAWGRTRVGLRCTQGDVRWNVYLPMTVKVYGVALVAAHAIAAGTELSAADLAEAEVDLAAEHGATLAEPAQALGRVLLRSVNAGDALRQTQLRARLFFAAGDTVRLVAQGPGFSVQGEGQALSAGAEGSTVRVRTESGRIVSGQAVGDRQVEVAL